MIRLVVHADVDGGADAHEIDIDDQLLMSGLREDNLDMVE